MLSNKSHLRFLNSVNNLSLRNLGLTGKNPSVACLIVDYSKSTNGKVLSYGLTAINGSPHAEVNALNKIKKNQITNKTFMYVSLEPCYKLDKCCAKRIVNIGIHNVIISSKDPNPIIKNKGIEFLKKNKINVFLAKKKFDQFKNINKYFFNFHEKNRPHITLKLAISKNNFSKDFRNKDITSQETQYFMHKYRLLHDAIAVGYNTYIEDNPKLTCRLNGINKNLFKLIFSSKSKIFINKNIRDLYKVEDLSSFFNKLIKKNIKSILIEGGVKTFSIFLENNSFDQILLCKSNKNIRGSKKRYQIDQNLIKKRCKLMSSMNYEDDVLEIYNNKYV